MKAKTAFVFIHPDTGLEAAEDREQCARLLHTLHRQGGWIEAIPLGTELGSLKVHARIGNIEEKHGGDVILKRDGRKAPNGRHFKEYCFNPALRVVDRG